MWELMTFKKTGRYHRRNGMMCQDQVCYKDVDQCQAIVLADGIGDSDINTYCVKEVVNYSADALLYIMNSELLLSGKRKIIDYLMGGVIRIISKYVEKGYAVSDLGSTLLGMAVDHRKGRYLLVHLGDGIIIGNSSGGTRVLSYPVNGSGNRTFLTTSDNLLKCMKVKIGKMNDLDQIILCSDGMGKDREDDQSFILLRRKE